MVLETRARAAAAWAAIPVGIALVTALGRAAGANATTIGFFYFAAVLALATLGGWAVGAAASVAAMLCFNFFFLPPLGALTIAQPANWVALIAFLGASTLASRLVATARREAEEAERRRREVEILYELCFGLFTTGQRLGALGEAAAHTLRAIGASSGALLLDGAGDLPVSVVGEAPPADVAMLARARETRRVVEAGSPPLAYIPLHVGEQVNGVLVAAEPRVSRAVLEPAGGLLGLAVERERLLAESAHLEAMRESDGLKTSLLRAVSHDLRTPLTAMRLAVDGLAGRLQDRPEAEENVRVLALEQERLTRRIDNLLSLARLEAGVARPNPEPVPPAALLRAARENLGSLLAGRPIEARVAPGCPEAWADPSLTVEILVNLLENAARAAPPGSPLELAAEPAPAAPASPERVRFEVRDRGPGVPPGVRRLFESAGGAPRAGESGDSVSGGLGLQIARGLAAANGGTLALLDRPGGGTIARLTLPAAPEPDLEEIP